MEASAWLVLRGLCRGLHLAGYFSASGTMVLAATLLRGEWVPGLKRLAWGGFALALAAGAAWFLLQTAYFASARSWGDIVNATPIVVRDTRFGELLLGRIATLLLAMLLFQLGWGRLAALLGLGGVLAQAWLGHGGAMSGPEGDVLLASAVLHLAGAALWLGVLPALLLALRHLPGSEAALLARRFSPLGMACVAMLLGTAVVQFVLLIGGVGALFASAYGALASAKILALAALAGLAARNKLYLTPHLPGSRAALCRALALEICLGLAVLLAAGLLLQLEPPAMAGMTHPDGDNGQPQPAALCETRAFGAGRPTRAARGRRFFPPPSRPGLALPGRPGPDEGKSTVIVLDEVGADRSREARVVEFDGVVGAPAALWPEVTKRPDL